VTPKNKPLRKPSSRSSDKSTKLGRVLVDSAKQIARHMRGEIELPMKVVARGARRRCPCHTRRTGAHARAICGTLRATGAGHSGVGAGETQTGTGGARLYARHQEPARGGAESPDSGVARPECRPALPGPAPNGVNHEIPGPKPNRKKASYLGTLSPTPGIYRLPARMAVLSGRLARPATLACVTAFRRWAGARVASLRCPILRPGEVSTNQVVAPKKIRMELDSRGPTPGG